MEEREGGGEGEGEVVAPAVMCEGKLWRLLRCVPFTEAVVALVEEARYTCLRTLAQWSDGVNAHQKPSKAGVL